MRQRILTISIMALFALLLTLPAHAQYPPSPGPTETETEPADTTPSESFSCDGLVAGSTAVCASGGWLANSPVDVTVAATSVLFDETVTAGANGRIAYSFDVPADLPAGTPIEFSHVGVLADGSTVTFATSAPAAAAPAAAPGLATTGGDIAAWFAAGLLALGLGTVVVRRTRRRTTSVS